MVHEIPTGLRWLTQVLAAFYMLIFYADSEKWIIVVSRPYPHSSRKSFGRLNAWLAKSAAIPKLVVLIAATA
jgi:hypothetical protein